MTRVTVIASTAAFAAGLGAGLAGYHLVGRAPGPSPEPPAPPVAAAPAPVLENRVPLRGLYTDEEIKELAAKWGAGDPQDPELLRVVPNGQTAPAGEVFAALGLDVRRVPGPSVGGHFNLTTTLVWDISPSYYLFCMLGLGDADNTGLELDDPRLRVYGVRLKKRDP